MLVKDSVKKVLPYQLRASMRGAGVRLLDSSWVSTPWFYLADQWDWLCGRGDPLTPPRKLVHAIGGSFHEVSRAYLRHFIDWAELKPDEQVLDVGCGTGRMAVALTGYLNEFGGYDGFDVMADCVAWCREHVTTRYPNFTFRQADLYNTLYNPRGRYGASEYRFPYSTESFDFVFLTSVFTHLLPADFDHYVSECARVLRPGGRCLATFFLLNEESKGLIQAGRSSLRFREHPDGYQTTDSRRPEKAIAFEEEYVLDVLDGHGLHVDAPIRRGSWCGRTRHEEAHDVLVAQKS